MMDGIGGVYTARVLEKFGCRFDFVPEDEDLEIEVQFKGKYR